MKKAYTVQLELYENSIKMTENRYVQGDAGVYPLEIRLLSNGKPFPLSAGAVVSIQFLNEKTGTVNRGVVEIADAAQGALVYHFVGSELFLDGETTASIIVQDGDARLTWQKFRFIVEASLDDGKTFTPGPYVPWTAQIDAEISKMKERLNQDGNGGGGSWVEVENGKLIINDTQVTLDADSIGGITAAEITKKTDLPGAVLMPPIKTITNIFPSPKTLTNWKYNNATLVQIENGIATIKNTHSTNANPSISRPSGQAALDQTHIYFLSWHMRAVSQNGSLAMLSFFNSMKQDVQAYTPPGRWCQIAAATKFPSGLGASSMNILNHTYTPGEYIIDFKEPILVDLTAVFGEGNEPDTNWCIRNIPFFEETTEISANNLEDKKILCIGDSNTSNGVYSYVNKLGKSAVNGGFAGATMELDSGIMLHYSAPSLTDAMIAGDLSEQVKNAGNAEFKHTSALLVKAAASAFDYTIIAFGTNDFDKNITLGVEDMSNETKSTFRGALRYCINRWQKEKPSVKLIVLTPGWRTDIAPSVRTFKNTLGLTLADYVNAIVEICTYYNVPVIDLYHGAGINDNNAKIYLQDGLHGSDAYHEIVAKKIIAAMTEI
jgi:lysophospholipase L1-like esterase